MSAQIVIVEDEVAICNLYKLKFELEGFRVQTADDGVKGYALAKKNQPDLILLDLLMPHMNGADMLAKLRATDWGGSIPVIILTNVSRDEAPAQLRFLGVSRYIVKAHYTPQQVVDVAREVLASLKHADR
jgi:DNA-binding response OmpR family regulator